MYSTKVCGRQCLSGSRGAVPNFSLYCSQTPAFSWFSAASFHCRAATSACELHPGNGQTNASAGSLNPHPLHWDPGCCQFVKPLSSTLQSSRPRTCFSCFGSHKLRLPVSPICLISSPVSPACRNLICLSNANADVGMDGVIDGANEGLYSSADVAIGLVICISMF